MSNGCGPLPGVGAIEYQDPMSENKFDYSLRVLWTSYENYVEISEWDMDNSEEALQDRLVLPLEVAVKVAAAILSSRMSRYYCDSGRCVACEIGADHQQVTKFLDKILAEEESE